MAPYHRQPFRRSVADLGSTPSTSNDKRGKMDTDKIKKEIFDLDDPADLAYSYFEVINTIRTDK